MSRHRSHLFSSVQMCSTSLWQRVYACLCIVVIPSLVLAMINGGLIIYVHASYRRVQPVGDERRFFQRMRLTRRDIRLLRQMLLMFVTFVGGWGPLYIHTIVTKGAPINLLVVRSLSTLAATSLLADVVYLFLYNHRMRQYAKHVLGNFVQP